MNVNTGKIALVTDAAAVKSALNTYCKGTALITWGGRIVNISSRLARFALPGYSACAAMKGGVEVLTRHMAKELGPGQRTGGYRQRIEVSGGMFI